MTAPKLTIQDQELQETLLRILLDDKEHALWTLASLTEACTHAMGEPLSNFMDRIIAYRDTRP
jgi:hypothetical protein